MFMTKSNPIMYNHRTKSNYIESVVYKISSAEALLDTSTHKQLFASMEKLVDIKPIYYQELYRDLIYALAEFAQAQPEVGQNNLFVVNQSLKRAYLAVQQFVEQRQNIINASSNHLDELICYAVFSSTLLNQIGMIATDRVILITDEHGQANCNWNVLEGPITASEMGEYFKIRWIKQLPKDYGAKLSLLIANKMVSSTATRWMMQYPVVHHAWINALLSFENPFDTLGINLEICEKDLQKIHLEDLPTERIDQIHTSVNEKFLKWLKEGIKNKKISVNQKGSAVHVTSGGVYINKAAITAKFKKAYPDTKFAMTYIVGNYLGISAKSGYDSTYTQKYGPRKTKSSVLSGGLYSKGVASSSKMKGSDGVMVAKKYLKGLPKENSKFVDMPAIRQAIQDYAMQHAEHHASSKQHPHGS